MLVDSIQQIAQKGINMNPLQIVGHLGKDAEQKYSKDGGAITTFSVAAKTSWKNKKGEWDSHTEWFDCVVFGNAAEVAARLLKGEKVMVMGEFRSREYQDKKYFEVKVNRLYRIAKDERTFDEGGEG
jgi:single stranded DNA-binding protein